MASKTLILPSPGVDLSYKRAIITTSPADYNRTAVFWTVSEKNDMRKKIQNSRKNPKCKNRSLVFMLWRRALHQQTQATSSCGKSSRDECLNKTMHVQRGNGCWHDPRTRLQMRFHAVCAGVLEDKKIKESTVHSLTNNFQAMSRHQGMHYTSMSKHE